MNTKSAVTPILSVVKFCMSRAVPVLVLIGLLCPVSAKMPADEIRAAYAAAGLMCDTNHGEHTHHEAQCVLCLLPGLGGAAGHTCARTERVQTVLYSATARFLDIDSQPENRRARAPPVSMV